MIGFQTGFLPTNLQGMLQQDILALAEAMSSPLETVTQQQDAGARSHGQDRCVGILQGGEQVLGGERRAADSPGCFSISRMGC